jgi:hypothetical protein
MLSLLTAFSIFNAVILAQLVAPGPAAPGGPYPYGIGPGGIRMAPGSSGSSTTPLSVAPEVVSVPREARRTIVKRPRQAHARRRHIKPRRAKARR